MLDRRACVGIHIPVGNGNQLRANLEKFGCRTPDQCAQEFFENNVTKFQGWDAENRRIVHVTIRRSNNTNPTA